MSVDERDVESYLRRKVERLGFLYLKFIPDYKNGMPDRQVLLPDGRVVWVELKTKGGRPSQLQLLRKEELSRAGHRVAYVWSKEQADTFCAELAEEYGKN